MRDFEITTRTENILDIKNRLASLVDDVSSGEARILIAKSGVPVAALVSIEDLRQLARLDEQRAERRRLLEMLREPFRGVSHEEIERETAKAVAEVQAEMRAERTAAKSA